MGQTQARASAEVLMTSGMFLRSGNVLSPLEPHLLSSEDELQELVEHNPQLLAACFDEEPSSWLLVRREAGVPLNEAGGDQFSLDHLLVTADAVPVLVEVKRASNREIRRQIVGQMLDYAANASRYWPIERVKAWFDETHGTQSAGRLLACCGGDTDPEAFWAQVSTNLRAGRLRLLFVADDIPPELQAIVEFLSGHLIDAEVAAIRIRQFGEGAMAAIAADRVGQVATPPPGSASAQVPFSVLLNGADDNFKRALSNVETWAASRGFNVSDGAKSRRVSLPNGQGAIYLYPYFRSLEVRIRPIRRGGHGATADAIVSMIAALPTGKAAELFPRTSTPLLMHASPSSSRRSRTRSPRSDECARSASA